ncbi:Protein SKT5 [Tolypocladium paradoxum]|uniref:Protein SKT5 n=1 Tax=Tolypocladium paradoxum TaxID=94208 RepID=A0A2S4L716_9HYPO|nr:Protein SKT5 [Tolypocladium paradoxum]
MAAISASPPPVSASPGSDSRVHASLHAMSSTVAAVGDVPRKPVALPRLPVSNARLGEAPVSPVRVNFHQDHWVQPSNANIELAQPQAAQFRLVDRTRDPQPSSTSAAVPHGSGDGPAAAHQELPELSTASNGPSQGQAAHAVSSIEFGHAPLDLHLSQTSATGLDRYDATAPSPGDPVQNQDGFRNSRESDETASTTQQHASAHSSAATSASSLSGINENAECPPNGESPGSSIIEGNLPLNSSIPQFQYHHQQEYPQRVSSVPSDAARTSSNPELPENAGPIRRHLTPTSGYLRRSSLPRPQSAYSNFSDYGPRGRSPNLMPGASHMRTPSVQSRKSPDVRPSSYAELLNIPYPQQAPAPLSLDNSNLRNAVGNNASLLSTQKTLEMYRQNVKKTNDFSIQYSFAVFLISTAQEQGLDVSDPKARKTSPQPLRDLDSPVVEGSVSSPYELVREARQILQRLANGGYPFAQYYLADGYASGLFSKGKEDYNSAFPLFVLAAKHGHAESAYRTALCYEFGWGCRKDPAKAVQFLRTAAAKRHPGAMTRLGKACLSGDLGEKRYREGIKWMKLATEAADTQYNAAPYQLGCLYETGYGDDVFQDLNYAAELFTQAADLGHPEANFRMGDAYEHGRLNCPRDPALSVHFYTGAAERGHAAGMMGLCAWYMVGAAPILEKDEEEAYEWSHRSAELGFVKAQYAVGYFTEMGIGCRRDVLEANVWYVKAADAGDERAKVRLAAIQKAVSGEGTPMDVAPPRNGKVTKGAKDDKDCVVM